MKSAIVKTTEQEPLDWLLVDERNNIVASGKTRPYGEDKAAGELDQLIDFSAFKAPGKGYKIKIGKDQSPPFDIGKDLYKKLKYDALAFFYHQRSGIEIAMPYAGGAQWTRPAGHVGDKSVACAPEAKCSYSLDVSGGWYDAGDHGKYVVNGGISVWTLQNEYERARYLGKNGDELGDGKLSIPEGKNGAPDLLDEARWEIEWMMRMQVPAGQPLAGMAHQQDPRRELVADPDAARSGSHQALAAPRQHRGDAQPRRQRRPGGPPVEDVRPRLLQARPRRRRARLRRGEEEPCGDRRGRGQGRRRLRRLHLRRRAYWAAAELYITTGKPEYKQELEASPHHKTITTSAGGGSASMSWDQVATLGKISLAVAPNGLGKAAIDDQRKQIVSAADTYLGFSRKRAYRVPLASETRYPWGSNSFILNDMVVMGLAFDFTKDPKYVSGVIDGMDYLLGKNPKVQSYVSGYGSRPLQNPHHRFWAHQKDPKLPSVPPGVVSGGPNSGVEDPYARSVGLAGCAPQQCYVDNIESWSTNEIALNWNAPLAWAAAFLDDVAHRR